MDTPKTPNWKHQVIIFRDKHVTANSEHVLTFTAEQECNDWLKEHANSDATILTVTNHPVVYEVPGSVRQFIMNVITVVYTQLS